MKTPCEIVVWHVLPVVRKELAKSLIENKNISQRKAAEMLGTTEASISRYLSGKRGKVEILDEKILKEIKKSASKITEGNGITLITETCKICNLLKSTNFIKGINYACE